MNMTRQAATITHTVSAATPAAEVAVVSSAANADTGMSAKKSAIMEPRPTVERLDKDVTSTN